MAYIEKRYYIRAGVIEVEQVQASMFGNHKSRSGRGSPTLEEVKKVNQKIAAKKLRRLIDANFEPGDIYLTLTYKKEYRRTLEEAKKDLKKFMDKLKYRYGKHGDVFKWIKTTGIRKRGAAHHHVICNNIDTFNYIKELAKIWPFGTVEIKALYEDGRYMLLAEYFVKHKQENEDETKENQINARAYSCSRNLRHPRVKRIVIKESTIVRAPKVPTGYRLDMDPDVDIGISKQSGYMYRYFRLIKVKKRE